MNRRRHDTPDHLQTLIDIGEADALIASTAKPTLCERVPLSEARGRVLREKVKTDRDLPPFDRIAMDGIAMSRTAWDAGIRRYRVEAVAAAGTPRLILTDSDACIEVMTGGVLPVGTDVVLPVEYLDVSSTPGWAEVQPGARADDHIHRRGSDRKAGEVILHPGIRLAARHIGILASVGGAEPLVSVQPSIAIVTTGDELVPVTTTPQPHQIRMSNGAAIAAAFSEAGYQPASITHLPDDREALLTALADLLNANDVLVISGGVSAGTYDFVPGVLEELGVDKLFHKVRQRPGKPLWFGVRQTGRRVVVFGLPGNPVSVLIGTIRYIVPYLRRCSGDETVHQTESVRMAEEVHFRPNLTLLLPVRLSSSSSTSVLEAIPVETNGSGDFAALASADGFVELPAAQESFPVGFIARVYRFGGQR